jgi:predicted amidohydrolase
MGSICPKCREWAPEIAHHKCSGIPIPSFNSGDRRIWVVTWQVNTLDSSPSPAKGVLAPMDVMARVKLLQSALATASQAMEEMAKASPDHANSGALKIFVAPEFFFSSPNGPVYEEQKELVRNQLIEISAKFHDILIIPGSITWWKAAQRSALRAQRKQEKPGLPKERDFSKYLALYDEKQPEASTDFAGWARESLDPLRKKQRALLEKHRNELKILHNTVFVLYDGTVWHKYNKRHEGVNEFEFSLEMKGSYEDLMMIFPPTHSNPNLPTINGIRIGVEVCADHEHASLLTYSAKSNHIHIVCSATVSVFRKHAAVMEGGVMIQADPDNSGVYDPDALPSGENEDEDPTPLDGKEVKFDVGILRINKFNIRI